MMKISAKRRGEFRPIGPVLRLAAALAAFAAQTVQAQDMLPPAGFGQPQGQDPYAALRLKQCRDLGSFAVVDAPADRSGKITVSPGSPCADLLSLQPTWMPYIQLNADVGRGASGQGAGGEVPWPSDWGPGQTPSARGRWSEPGLRSIGPGRPRAVDIR